MTFFWKRLIQLLKSIDLFTDMPIEQAMKVQVTADVLKMGIFKVFWAGLGLKRPDLKARKARLVNIFFSQGRPLYKLD